MKIRNKKTGKIVELDHFSMHYNRPEEWGMQPCSTWNYSLAELNNEWEDVRAPLITTNRVRELLKNWADYNDIDEVEANKDVETGLVSFSCAYAYIDFYVHEPFVKEGEHYTIEELCEGA